MKKLHIVFLSVVPIIMMALGVEGYLENEFSSRPQPSSFENIISNLQSEENTLSPKEALMLESLETSSFELNNFSDAYFAMDEANSYLLEAVFWLSILQFIAIAHVYTKTKAQPVDTANASSRNSVNLNQ
jgi:hypothetical protein